MNKHKLLTMSLGSRGRGLFLIGLLLLAVALADRFYRPFLGSWAIVVWGLSGIVLLAAILMWLPVSLQSGYIQVEPEVLIIRYGPKEIRIGYDEIDTITGSRVSQHYSLKEFSRRERRAVRPYFNQTHILITLHEGTKVIEEARKKLPLFMLGSTQPGLILLVEGDWLAVERSIDGARVAWLAQEKETYQYNDNSLAFELWDEDEYDDEEDYLEA